MKAIFIILALFTTNIYADEMEVIGKFKNPGVDDDLYWIELQSDTHGAIQCIVKNGYDRGGVSCNWPEKTETNTAKK